jgi:hypothetical protein
MSADLEHLLGQLHTAVEKVDSEAERAELRRLVEAVEQRIGQAPPAERHLVDSLRNAEARFDADHPVLGAALRRAIDGLSSAGI